MPVCIGERTAIAAAMATHASAAVPPLSRTRSPITAALGCSQATAPFVPKTVERPPGSGLLTVVASFRDTGYGPPLRTYDRSYSLSEGPASIVAPVNVEEVTHGRRQRNLRGWDPDLHPHLSGPVFLGQARVGDLRRTLGPHDIEPGAEPPGRGLN